MIKEKALYLSKLAREGTLIKQVLTAETKRWHAQGEKRCLGSVDERNEAKSSFWI